MIGIRCKTIDESKLKKGDKILYTGACYNKFLKNLFTVDNYFIDLPLSIYEIIDVKKEDDVIHIQISIKEKIKVAEKDYYKWISSDNIIVLLEED